MNWFLMTYNTHSEKSISEKIQKEFGQSNLKDIVVNGLNYTFRFVSNRGKKIVKYENENIVIIGDINIHNASDLFLQYDKSKTIEEVIAHLYTKKGIRVLDDLVGEFAFFLIDKKINVLFSIRDQIGIKTLFGVKKEKSYIFASDIFLLEDYFDIKKLNSSFFNKFIERKGIYDGYETPYAQVYRVSSGSYMECDNSRDEMKKYWDLSWVKTKIHYRHEQDYLDEFLRILSKSITDRIIDGDNNSIMLSGGLDSTSIYALAKTNKSERTSFSPISIVFDKYYESDERNFIEGLLEKYNETGTYVNLDNKLMYKNFPYNSPFAFEPSVVSLSYEFNFHILKKAASLKKYNVFTGCAGDHLLTGSLFMTADELRRLKIKKAFKYVTEYSINTNSSSVKNFKKYTLSPDVAAHYIPEKNDYYSELKGIFSRIKSRNQQQLYYQILHSKSFHYLDRIIGATTGTDLNHPFLDRRLIEFIYKIPSDYRFNPDSSKYILRESTKAYLTNEITERKNKTTHLAYNYASIRENWKYIERLKEDPYVVKELGLISKESWKNEMDKWRNGVLASDRFWGLLGIEKWFMQYERKLTQN